jgi:lipopolysaccharide export system permease protein
VSFDRYGQRLPEEPGLARSEPVDARATLQLLRSPAADDRAALHWRLSLVFMVPVVALVALGMSKTNHRRGRYAKLAPALLLHLAYLLLLAGSRTRIAEGDAQVWQMWAIHGLFLALALLLLFAPDRWQRLRAR